MNAQQDVKQAGELSGDSGVLPADQGPVAHDPERAAFEAWWCRAYHEDALRDMENCCYLTRGAGMAWDAWQAARPPRHEISRLINLAAECAQRKPLRALEPLTEVSHIGHRQFGRAYAGADEAVRLLAIELRRVADAL